VAQTIASKPDYLAIILIGTGSSWGRSSDKEAAIQNAIKSYRDWDCYFKVADTDVTVNVIDVQGYGDCSWGAYPGGWMYGKNEATGEQEKVDRPVEQVTRRTPKWRARR
jgi:hypothetical protein